MGAKKGSTVWTSSSGTARFWRHGPIVGVVALASAVSLTWAGPGGGRQERTPAKRDICKEGPEALSRLRTQEAERISTAYQETREGQFRLTGGACDWTCSAPSASPLSACLSSWQEFLTYSCDSPERKLGRSLTDAEYYRQASARWRSRGRDMMAPPPSLTQQLSRKDLSLADLTAFLRSAGLRYVQYSSTSVSGPDGPEKIMILAEGAEYDQWIQVAVKQTNPKSVGEQVDFIAVEKNLDPETGGQTARPTVFFKEYSRSPSGLTTHGGAGTRSLPRCTSCHASGLRTLIPDPTRPVVAYPSDSLAEFQSRMAISPMSHGPGYSIGAHGPVMGPADRQEPERLRLMAVSGCAGPRPEESRRKIAAAMACATCHNGVNRGVLNAGADLSTLRHKVAAPEGGIADRGRMPPQSASASSDEVLTVSERNAVFECLKAEYAADLKSWLLAQRCAVNPSESCADCGQTGRQLLPGSRIFPFNPHRGPQDLLPP